MIKIIVSLFKCLDGKIQDYLLSSTECFVNKIFKNKGLSSFKIKPLSSKTELVMLN